jgi:hypothetical protein
MIIDLFILYGVEGSPGAEGTGVGTKTKGRTTAVPDGGDGKPSQITRHAKIEGIKKKKLNNKNQSERKCNGVDEN